MVMDLIDKANALLSRDHFLRQMEQSSTIGERLRLARETTKINQLAVAEKLGLKTAGSVSRFEKNMRRPSLELLKNFAAVYEIDVMDLIPEQDSYRQLLTSLTTQNPSEAESQNTSRLIRIKLNDDFMAPLFLKGDFVFVDPDIEPTYAGQFCFVKCKLGKIACQLYFESDAFVAKLLHPLHAHLTITVKTEDIVGVIVELRRQFYPLPNEGADTGVPDERTPHSHRYQSRQLLR